MGEARGFSGWMRRLSTGFWIHVMIGSSSPRIAARTSGFTMILLPIGTSSLVRSVSQTVIGHRAFRGASGSRILRCVTLICAVADMMVPSGLATETCSLRLFQPRRFQLSGIMNVGDKTSICAPGLTKSKVSSTVSNSTRCIFSRTAKELKAKPPPTPYGNPVHSRMPSHSPHGS